jgi:NDP-sugar pyrophosphorylase family protein
MEAILLAGGKGSRLSPFTKILPKPLLPIGSVPIAELLVRRLHEAGCTKIYFSIGYLGEYIKMYFGDGQKWGIPIHYVEETEPLGTIGPLAHIPLTGPTWVLNGDIFCSNELDLLDLYRCHLANTATLTILSAKKTLSLDFGALTTTGDRVTQITEKPHYDFLISAGIYLVNPEVLTYLPEGYCDMPTLLQALIKDGKRVCHYACRGLWMDLGRMEDLLEANRLFAES